MKIGCFYCGEQDGETYEDELGRTYCQVCDTRSIVTFTAALDLLKLVDMEGAMPTWAQETIDNEDTTPRH